MSGRNAHLAREQAIAVYNLLEYNTFAPVGHEGGSYCLSLVLADARPALRITTEQGVHVVSHHLSLTSLRRLFALIYAFFANRYPASVPEAPQPDLRKLCTGAGMGHLHSTSAVKPRERSDLDDRSSVPTMPCDA
ncbi:UPF0262 family protein [Mesorhizobium captivum]|uniref:UPF0262 family protein n=1 Tax=Mesorhizobium captivum TaxID=3072319 RepID=UPI002A24E06E|nr:UPF0262 family protein [Mesorhizobium sp. VK3C]MDX8450819.1 UPF0262 family protein [Mesorhizobium sp. VK3C]